MRRKKPIWRRNLLEMFDNSAVISPRVKVELPIDIEALHPKVVPKPQMAQPSHQNFSFQNINFEPDLVKTEAEAGGESYKISPTRKKLAQQYSISVTLCSPKSTVQLESSPSITPSPIVSLPGVLDRPSDASKLISIKTIKRENLSDCRRELVLYYYRIYFFVD